MDEKELEKLINEYTQALSDLDKSRKEESEKLSKLSEDELASSLENDYQCVLEDAKKSGVTIAIVPTDEDK